MEMNDKKRRQSMILYVIIAIAILFAINQGSSVVQHQQVQQVSYSDFLTMVDGDKVDEVELDTGDSTIRFTTKQDGEGKVYETNVFPNDDGLVTRLSEHDVNFSANITTQSGDNIWLLMFLYYGLPIIIFFLFGWWLNRRMRKQMGDDPSMDFSAGGFGGFGGGGLGKSNAKIVG